MRKPFFVLIAVVAASFCLVSCNSKSNQPDSEADAQQVNAEQNENQESEATTLQDGTELDNLYTVCPLLLQDQGKVDADGNPVTVERKWICGASVGVRTMAEWVLFCQDSKFNFNVDGWHFVGKDIVNADETYKMNAEDAIMSLSSFCTIRTEKYQKPSQKSSFTYVAFNSLRALVDDPDFELSGIKVVGNRHDYNSPELEEYIQAEPNIDNVQTSFYLNEYLTVTLPKELEGQDLTLVVLPYQYNYEEVTFDDEKLAEASVAVKPELNEEKTFLTSEFYVSIDSPVGCYDLLLVNNKKALYRLTMIMSKESED